MKRRPPDTALPIGLGAAPAPAAAGTCQAAIKAQPANRTATEANAHVEPRPARIAPPISGPIARAPLNTAPSIAGTTVIMSRLTTCGSSACQTMATIASPVPATKTLPINTPTPTLPSTSRTTRATEAMSSTTEVDTRSRRWLVYSAIAPIGSAKRKNGMLIAN